MMHGQKNIKLWQLHMFISTVYLAAADHWAKEHSL